MLAFEYRAAGIIPQSAPILFADGIDLAGEYIGQSEERTKKLLNSTIEGIIIIDEIDSLLDVGKFGLSVLNTINVHMGNAVNSPIIIATCYTSKKDELLKSNYGLEGRFRHVMHMPEYSIDDLADMFVEKVHNAGLVCGNGVRRSVKEVLAQAKKGKGELFANAREVQNIFDATIDTHATRLYQQGLTFSRHTERQS